jgi:hypothetical protein
MGDSPCDIKLLLLSQLSAASEAHARQTALLTSIAVSGDHAEFSNAFERCGGMQRLHEAAKNAIKKHREAHGC